MKPIKLSHILFSLALIAALTIAAVPAPVHALAASSAGAASTGNTIAANQSNAPIVAANSTWVCKSVVVWRHGHRIVVRKCHKAEKPAA
jgi:hypothetical protein